MRIRVRLIFEFDSVFLFASIVHRYKRFAKNKVSEKRASHVRVRGPEKRPIEWLEKVCLRASEPRLRASKVLFSIPSQNRNKVQKGVF